MSITAFLGTVARVIINPLIVFGFLVALLYFFFGIFKFVASAGDDKARGTNKQAIVWGLIGMFIMIGVFGIIHVILGTFGINNDSHVTGNSYVNTLLH